MHAAGRRQRISQPHACTMHEGHTSKEEASKASLAKGLTVISTIWLG